MVAFGFTQSSCLLALVKSLVIIVLFGKPCRVWRVVPGRGPKRASRIGAPLSLPCRIGHPVGVVDHHEYSGHAQCGAPDKSEDKDECGDTDHEQKQFHHDGSDETHDRRDDGVRQKGSDWYRTKGSESENGGKFDGVFARELHNTVLDITHAYPFG